MTFYSKCLKIITGIFLLSLCLSPAGTTLAQTQDTTLSMTVSAFLDGHFKYGEWLPLHVSLSNQGADVNAEVQVTVDNSSGQIVYATPAQLPSGARKEITLYVRPPTFGQSLTVRLVQDNQVLHKTEVKVAAHPHNEYIIAIVSPTPDAFAILNGLALQQRPTRVLPLSIDNLPERPEVLRNINVLILADSDTSTLSPQQGEALHAWIKQGGQLLIGGGVGAQRTVSGLPAALHPFELEESHQISQLDALETFTTMPIQVPGPFLITPAIQQSSKALIKQEQTPLLIQNSIGDGWVTYLALDPAGSPFDAWNGTLIFWENLLKPGSALSSNRPQDISEQTLESEQISYALNNTPTNNLPSIRWLALLLGAYILLVGPANYFLLKRLHRLDWAWITIPLLTLIFSASSYGLGYSLRGNDVIINRITILPLSTDGERPMSRSYVGIFSPSRSNYTLEIEAPSLVSALSQTSDIWGGAPGNSYGNQLNILQGETVQVRNLDINQWSMKSFQSETWLEKAEGSVKSNLWIENNRVHGFIENNLERPLTGILLTSGQYYARLGDVAAGEHREIDLAVEDNRLGEQFPWVLFSNMNTMENSDEEFKRRVLEAYFNTNWGVNTPDADIKLLGWSDISPYTMKINGVNVTENQTTLVEIKQPFLPQNGHVSIPIGSLVGKFIEFGGDAGDCGVANQIYLGQGHVIIEYNLPNGLENLIPNQLTLQQDAQFAAGQSPLSISLYNWETSTWIESSNDDQTTISGTLYTIAEPQRFINSLNHIQLKVAIDVPQNGGACYSIGMGVEGDMPDSAGDNQ